MRKLLTTLLRKIRFFNKPRVLTTFPISDVGKVLIGNFIHGRRKSFYVSYYQEYRSFFPSRKYDYRFYKLELTAGNIIKGSKVSVNSKVPALLPIASPSEDSKKIGISINGKPDSINLNDVERIYYLKFKDKIELFPNKDLFVGEPLELQSKSNHSKKLVLTLFIDGLTREIWKDRSMAKFMPNTYKFFNNGVICNNCYSNSEWSLPSLASISTGKYTINHEIFHKSKPKRVSDNNIIISEFFKNEGFLTFQVCGNWRRNPYYGYIEGFDRSIYKHSLDSTEVINAFFEHILTFKKRNNFVWLSFMDLHHHINGVPTISQQLDYEVHDHNYQESSEKSVFSKKNLAKTHRYIAAIKHLDFQLGILFQFLNDNYSPGEYLVSFFSDHGQAYLSEDSHPLAAQRTAVPLMFRGTAKDGSSVSSLVENIDILPTILFLSEIKQKEQLDGEVISHFTNENNNKKWAISESLFSGQTYKAVCRDKNGNEFFFESKQIVNDDGTFNPNDVQLIKDCILIEPIDGSENLKAEASYVLKKHFSQGNLLKHLKL